jgi:hypothetical protein
MIDPTLFTVEAILDAMFYDTAGNVNAWRKFAVIMPKYMPAYPDENTKPKCVVKFGDSFLRYSHGPVQGFFWDFYGGDMQSPAIALMALMEAPVPPWLINKDKLPNANQSL